MNTFPETLLPDPPIAAARKIACIAALACAGLAGAAATAPASPARATTLERAALTQRGRLLVLALRTSRPLGLARLDRLPRRGDRAGHLCLELRRAGAGGRRRLCIGGADHRRRAGLELLNARGGLTRATTVAATVSRPQPRKLVLSLQPDAAGLSPRRYRWRVAAQLGRCRPAAERGCETASPARGARAFRLRPVRAVGCTGGRAGLVSSGPRDRPVVALTFDDGPSEYTPGFLDVLRREGVPGTFFEVGQEIPGREATLRRILREGGEIGNHTTHHTELPGLGAIAPTTSLVEAATGFRPCLFRPPGGAVSSAVLAAAGADGLRTVTWDVDPSDWSTPGSAAVYSRVVGATRPGSIVLMHDGGGNRAGTLAALPRIIATLRARGYRFATVTELLGERLIYQALRMIV